MLPPFAPAALAAETIAPPAELPTATQYIQDTDGVDDGAVYAIYTNVSPDASNRILYHTGTGKTDKVGGTVSGNTLALYAPEYGQQLLSGPDRVQCFQHKYFPNSGDPDHRL